MGTVAKRAPRSLDDLAPVERERLVKAHRRLKKATKSYEPFLGGALSPMRDISAHEMAPVAAAQMEVQQAEDALWQLREELLGWARPSWAPRATLVADWFSDEDRIYDDLA